VGRFFGGIDLALESLNSYTSPRRCDPRLLQTHDLNVIGKEADMLRQVVFGLAIVCGAAGVAFAQNAATADNSPSAWRPTGDSAAPPATQPAAPPAAPANEPAPRALAPAAPTVASLPSDAGQVWREYDISPYTARVTSTKRPEQAIIDWILRDTGYEAWHAEPLGILSANNRTLRVYHTPEMQKLVADIVDRFTSTEAATYTFSMRVVTLDSPNWRTGAQRLLRAVPVQTPGVNAWLLPKENAAIVLGELRRRNDYREHSSPYLMVNNGQSTVISAMRGRPYVRDVTSRPDLAAGFEASPGQVDEGFAIDFSPLLLSDRRMIDATIKCEIDQIEKMIPVMVDVPTQSSPRQRTKIESPQIVHFRLHERFRWPVDQVLVVGAGMVALPIPVDGAPLVRGVPLPIGNTPARADLLIFIECKGTTAAANSTTTPRTPQREAKNYRGRY
jgi:hypothetical protein